MSPSSTSSSERGADGPGRSLDLHGLSLRSLVFAGVLLCLFAVAGELAARAAARHYAYLNERMLRYDPLSNRVEPHGEFGFRQKPGASFRYPAARAHINAQGFRGPEVEMPRPPDRIRILVLGGSPMHGWGVQDDETIDAYMREIYRQRGRTDVDVVNLAMDAYDSWQIFERLRTEAPAHAPQIVVVHAGIVDVGNARFADLAPADPRTLKWEGALGRFRDGGGPTLGDRIKHASRAVQFVLLKQDEWAAKAPVGRELRIDVDVHPDAVVYFGENLRRIAAYADEIGAALLLVTPPSGIAAKYAPEDVRPYGFWIGSALETERYRHALAREMARVAREEARAGRRVKYLAPRIDDELFLDDAHLRPEGNRALAGQFVRALDAWLDQAAPAHDPQLDDAAPAHDPQLDAAPPARDPGLDEAGPARDPGLDEAASTHYPGR